MKRFTLKIITVAMFGSAAISSLPVAAHGYLSSPAARQVACYDDGGYWSTNGEDIPNAACKAAFDESGTTQFIQKNEIAKLVSDYNNIDAVKKAIPDGEICSAGDSSKSGLNLAHPDWKKTSVQISAENTIAVAHIATAPHNPSFRQFYLTKESYDPSMPINWDDLELIHEDDYTVMAKNNTFIIPVPAGRSGDAVLVSRWQRYDPAGEGFYNCADITLVSNGSQTIVTPTPEPTDPIVSLVEIGSFLETGIIANSEIDDTVRFRIFDATGKETTDISLQITGQNQDSWPGDLADRVMLETDNTWVIGNWHGDHYMYDWNNHYANKVFAPSTDFAYQLSLLKFVPAVTPTPIIDVTPTPMVTPTPIIDVTPTPIITPTPIVTPTAVPTPVVTPIPTIPVSGTWETGATYNSGAIVTYDGKEYTAKWWTKGDRPGASDVWAASIVAGDTAWNKSVAYGSGEKVSYEGKTWQAKWWTKGDAPGTNSVWKNVQ